MEYEMQKWQFPMGIKRALRLRLYLKGMRLRKVFLKKQWNWRGISASICHVVEDGPVFDN